jgi:hypothetical protein
LVEIAQHRLRMTLRGRAQAPGLCQLFGGKLTD